MLSLASINKVGQRDLFGSDETNIFQRKCTNFYLHLSNIKPVFYKFAHIIERVGGTYQMISVFQKKADLTFIFILSTPFCPQYI